MEFNWKHHLILGFFLSLMIQYFYLTKFIFWLIGTVLHEGGHLFFNLLTACPALPTIRLDGHAACVSRSQIFFVAIIIWLIFIYNIYVNHKEDKHNLKLFFIVSSIIYPIISFVPTIKLFLLLLAGHGTEIIIAGVFFFRVKTGLLVQNEIDRLLNSTLAWYLIITNLVFAFSVSFIDSARAKYYSGGSFGLTNDFVRISNDITGLDISFVLIPFFLITLTILPVSLYIAHIMIPEKTIK